MERTSVTFLGAVLKEIACTPNANFDPDDYQRRVVEPTRAIRKLDDQAGGADLPAERRREVFETLRSVLDAKQVPPSESEDRLSALAQRFALEDRPDATPAVASWPTGEPAGVAAAL